jgi:hypothetical protein
MTVAGPVRLSDRGERWRSLLLLLILLACFGYSFPRWADPNQNSRLDMVFAIVDDHTFQIDRYLANTVDYARVGGHYYSDKAPGIAFLGVPVYAAIRPLLNLPGVQALEARLAANEAFRSTLRPEGTGLQDAKVRFAIVQVLLTFMLAGVPSALLGVGMYRWLAHVTPDARLRLAVVAGYGLLSPVFAYAGALYGHQLAAAFLFGAFLLAYEGKARMRAGRLAAIGALLAASVVTEYPAAIVASVIGAYTCVQLIHQRQARAVGWLVLGGLPLVAGWMAYNTAVFGAPWNLGYAYSTLWTAEHQVGFMSLTIPSAESIWGITFSAFRGLFLLSPLLLVSALGFLAWWRSGRLRAEWWLAATASLGMIWFNASSGMWWGGFAVGPRYLLPGLPFLALGLTFALQAWGSRPLFRWAFFGAGLWSLAATWGLTLAGQAFPSDALHNPLLQHAWPNWVAGNLARNLGTLVGLPGAYSLLPLAGAVVVLVIAGWLHQAEAYPPVTERSGSVTTTPSQSSPLKERSVNLRGEANR